MTIKNSLKRNLNEVLPALTHYYLDEYNLKQPTDKTVKHFEAN